MRTPRVLSSMRRNRALAYATCVAALGSPILATAQTRLPTSNLTCQFLEQYRPGDSLRGIDFEARVAHGECSLAGRDLSRGDFSRTTLVDGAGAKFRASNLRAAFVWGDFRGADFSDADLVSAVFFRGGRTGRVGGADLRNATFSGADLRFANFTDTDVRGADFTGCSRAWAGSDWTDARFDERTRLPFAETRPELESSTEGRRDDADFIACWRSHRELTNLRVALDRGMRFHGDAAGLNDRIERSEKDCQAFSERQNRIYESPLTADHRRALARPHD